MEVITLEFYNGFKMESLSRQLKTKILWRQQNVFLDNTSINSKVKVASTSINLSNIFLNVQVFNSLYYSKLLEKFIWQCLSEYVS